MGAGELVWLREERLRLIQANEHWHLRVSQLTTENEAWSEKSERLQQDIDERNIDIIGADLVTDMAADKKLADIVRQLWEDWQCGYDALTSYQWDLLKAELGTIPCEPDEARRNG